MPIPSVQGTQVLDFPALSFVPYLLFPSSHEFGVGEVRCLKQQGRRTKEFFQEKPNSLYPVFICFFFCLGSCMLLNNERLASSCITSTELLNLRISDFAKE